MTYRLNIQEAAQAVVDTISAHSSGNLKNRVSLFDYTPLNRSHSIYVVVKPESVSVVPMSFGDNYLRTLTCKIDVMVAHTHAAPNHQKAFFTCLDWIDEITGLLFDTFNMGTAGYEIEASRVVRLDELEMMPFGDIPDAFAHGVITLDLDLPETN